MSKEIMLLRNITKGYGNKIVLENISLSILEAQTLAVVGPNGTGKSTLLRIIAGLSNYSKGERIVAKENGTLKINYVPERFPKLNFSPYEYLCHMGRIQGLSQDTIDDRVNDLFEIFHLNSMRDTWIKNLSKGSIQKVAVLQAILTESDILLLDEPLSGQDGASQENLVSLLLKYKQKFSIVLACHEKNLVEKLADRVIEIENRSIISDPGMKYTENTACKLICFTVPPDFNPEVFEQFEGIVALSNSGQAFRLLAEEKICEDILLEIIHHQGKIGSVMKSYKYNNMDWNGE